MSSYQPYRVHVVLTLLVPRRVPIQNVIPRVRDRRLSTPRHSFTKRVHPHVLETALLVVCDVPAKRPNSLQAASFGCSTKSSMYQVMKPYQVVHENTAPPSNEVLSVVSEVLRGLIF